MGCASSKTAEDKEEMAKKRKSKSGSPSQQPNSGSASNLAGGAANSATAAGNNGKSAKMKTSGANNMSGSLTGAASPPTTSQSNLNKNTSNVNAYVANNLNGSAAQAQSETNGSTNNNNMYLLIEFFKAVGNGELDRLKQILANLDEITAKNRIKMSRGELLNEGMADADGLTALSIAAGRKHKELTEYLASLEEVDVNKASESGITPLLMVAEVGWTDVMKKLLKRGKLHSKH